MKTFYQVVAIGILFSVIFTQGLEHKLFASEPKSDAPIVTVTLTRCSTLDCRDQ